MVKSVIDPSSQTLPFWYNLDGAVGNNGMNKADDVALVQWLMKKVGAKSSSKDLSTMASRVALSGKCDNATIDCIIAFQTLAPAGATTVDGRVSVAHGSSYGGGKTFLIWALNSTYKERYSDTWPMLDWEADSIWAITNIVSKCLRGQ